MVFILLMVALGFMGSGGRYVAFGGEPNWSKTENEKSMRIESDIPLKGGETRICSQVVLKYNGIIFMIINVRGVYCENKVQLINEKEKSYFQWMYSSDAKKRLENFRSTVYKMMKEEGEQLAIQQVQFCECQLEWIAKVDYQNLKRNKGRKRQLLYSSGMVARIPVKEVQYRDSEYWVNIKDFGKNEDIEHNRELTGWIRESLKNTKVLKKR